MKLKEITDDTDRIYVIEEGEIPVCSDRDRRRTDGCEVLGKRVADQGLGEYYLDSKYVA